VLDICRTRVQHIHTQSTHIMFGCCEAIAHAVRADACAYWSLSSLTTTHMGTCEELAYRDMPMKREMPVYREMPVNSTTRAVYYYSLLQ